MNGSDWKDLEQAWQNLPGQAAPAITELKRARRWQWWSKTYLIGEIVMTVAGFVTAGWIFTRGDTFSIIMSGATIIFVSAAACASWWARSQPPVRTEDSVMQSIAAAIHRVERGLRFARASLWTICAALAYVAMFATSVAIIGSTSVQSSAYPALALTLAWLCVYMAGTLIYTSRRSADLERLKAIEASLQSDA